jgi:uncharacterized protein
MSSDKSVGNTRDLVVSALDSLFANDLEGFFAQTKDDVQIIEPAYLPYGGTYVGREGFRDLGRKISKVLDMRSIELVSATGDDERTILLMTATLRNSGEQRYLTEHWVVEDNLIAEIRVFWSGLAD